MLRPLQIAARAAGACALTMALAAPVQAAPMLEMSAASTAAGIDVTVHARDFVDLSAYQFTLEFEPALVTALGSTEGSFLSGGGTTFFSEGAIDNTAGAVSFVLGGLIGLGSSVTGSGELATLSFATTGTGLANFRLSDVMLLDATGAVLTVDVRNLVTAVPEPASLALFAAGLFALLGARALKAKAR